jgi:dCMP deaminase
MLNEKWDRRYLELAKLVASWSKDPSTQTGAVFVSPKREIISVGYNGFAQNVNDTNERYNDRAIKYEMIIHCEENALIFADRNKLSGCCLYTYPFMSCSRCAAKMIQAGVKRVVSYENNNPRWVESFKLSTMQFNEAGVEIVLYN